MEVLLFPSTVVIRRRRETADVSDVSRDYDAGVREYVKRSGKGERWGRDGAASHAKSQRHVCGCNVIASRNSPCARGRQYKQSTSVLSACGVSHSFVHVRPVRSFTTVVRFSLWISRDLSPDVTSRRGIINARHCVRTYLYATWAGACVFRREERSHRRRRELVVLRRL